MSEEMKAMEISPETRELLNRYIKAFCNLYGITPVYRAWRIIRKQNPELELTEEQFLSFLDNMDEDETFCIVVGQEEIYEDIDGPTPPLKREIVFQYLYAVDDFESYVELKEQQEDKPFYVPDREEMLQYADDDYSLQIIRLTREYQALREFAEKTLKLKEVDEVLEEILLTAAIDGGISDMVEDTLYRVGKMKKFPSEEAGDMFYQLCEAMCGNVRMNAHRGHTPREIAILCG